MIKAFKKIVTKNLELHTLQQNLEAFIIDLLSSSFLNGVKLENVVLSGSNIRLAHGLGKKYSGFIVLKKNSNSNIYLSSSQPNTDLYIYLNASATTTCDIWVF